MGSRGGFSFESSTFPSLGLLSWKGEKVLLRAWPGGGQEDGFRQTCGTLLRARHSGAWPGVPRETPSVLRVKFRASVILNKK